MNVIFIHIAKIGYYQKIVDDIYDSIFSSHLIENVDKIYLSILGDGDIQIPHDSKNQIIFESPDINLFEFPTLNLLKSFASNNDCNILYLHTKGVNNDSKPINDWRKYMLYFNVYGHEDAIEKLKSYDTYGVDLRNDPVLHYSGNFWWSKSQYIKTLPDFGNMPVVISERHKAEFWICYNKQKHYSAWDCGINVYERHLHEYPENKYR